MIDRLIELSARHRGHRPRPRTGDGDVGRLEHQANSHRCLSRPQRHSVGSLLALGSQRRPHRRSGHLPHRHRHVGSAEGQGRARCFRFRLFLRLRRLRGGHRPVLGALPNSRVSRRSALHLARRRQDRARARCHRARMGLSVCLDGRLRKTLPGGIANYPGLFPALPPARSSGRGGSRLGRRFRARNTRSPWMRAACAPSASRSRP